jgi:hypothetical protein
MSLLNNTLECVPAHAQNPYSVKTQLRMRSSVLTGAAGADTDKQKRLKITTFLLSEFVRRLRGSVREKFLL